jgi:hypothetical protein
MMGHDSLSNHIQTNFSLIQHHKWSLSDINDIMPWEKYIYVDLLNAFLREEEEKAKQRENERKNMMQQYNRRKG